ncbi:MAG: hypothetical protein KDK90_26150 [Leptospiraceae bacterium]|nr:hypothetical protein [Leptospiraceae bacterium]
MNVFKLKHRKLQLNIINLFSLFLLLFVLLFATINIFNYNYILFSKQTGEQKSCEFQECTDEEILEEYKNAKGKYRKKLEKELKARGIKNKNKHRGNKQ